MAVTRWYFDYGGDNEYEFERNPDRYGGDSGWNYEPTMNENKIVGSNRPNIQNDGFIGRRTISFTAITGTMKRALQNFHLRGNTISNCRDHLYPTTTQFNCYVTSFESDIHPTIGDFPGSEEDTYDVQLTLVRMD